MISFMPLIVCAITSVLLFGCQTMNGDIKQAVFVESNKELLKDIFKNSGNTPAGGVSYSMLEDYFFRLSRDESIKTDLFIPSIVDESPLVVISHGNGSYKEAHYKQAQRLASWGFHVLALQLPHRKQWMRNGKRIEKIVRTIYANPSLISNRVDTSSIILVGHSFGGSAISVAAGSGAPVKALIYLDPAVVHSKVKKYLKKIKSPAFLIGADKQVFLSKRREWFARYIPGEFTELTVGKSTHNDAQYPSLPSLNQMGFDSTTSVSKQEIFLKNILLGSALVAKNSDFGYLKFFLSKQEKLGSIRVHTSKSQLSMRQNRFSN